jgi:hypothetical protein
MHRIVGHQARNKEHRRDPDKDDQEVLNEPGNQVTFYKVQELFLASFQG